MSGGSPRPLFESRDILIRQNGRFDPPLHITVRCV